MAASSDPLAVELDVRGVTIPIASSTPKARSLRESGEQDQPQEKEPRVHSATADAHGLCR